MALGRQKLRVKGRAQRVDTGIRSYDASTLMDLLHTELVDDWITVTSDMVP